MNQKCNCSFPEKGSIIVMNKRSWGNLSLSPVAIYLTESLNYCILVTLQDYQSPRLLSPSFLWIMLGVWGCVGCVCVWGVWVCVCLAYTSEDFHMKTPRHTEDSTPSEDPKTGPRKTLAKNAENVMFYHLRGGPRSEDLNGLPTLPYIWGHTSPRKYKQGK